MTPGGSHASPVCRPCWHGSALRPRLRRRLLLSHVFKERVTQGKQNALRSRRGRGGEARGAGVSGTLAQCPSNPQGTRDGVTMQTKHSINSHGAGPGPAKPAALCTALLPMAPAKAAGGRALAPRAPAEDGAPGERRGASGMAPCPGACEHTCSQCCLAGGCFLGHAAATEARMAGAVGTLCVPLLAGSRE